MVVGPPLPPQACVSCRHSVTPSFPSEFHIETLRYLQTQVQPSNTAVPRQVIYMALTHWTFAVRSSIIYHFNS